MFQVCIILILICYNMLRVVRRCLCIVNGCRILAPFCAYLLILVPCLHLYVRFTVYVILVDQSALIELINVARKIGERHILDRIHARLEHHWPRVDPAIIVYIYDQPIKGVLSPYAQRLDGIAGTDTLPYDPVGHLNPPLTVPVCPCMAKAGSLSLRMCGPVSAGHTCTISIYLSHPQAVSQADL